MKNNKVRMNISREMHEWFTAIDGKTNDERMQKLKGCKLKADTLESLYIERGEVLISASKMGLDYQEKFYKSQENSRILAGWLTVAITANFGFLVYVALVNGWFA